MCVFFIQINFCIKFRSIILKQSKVLLNSPRTRHCIGYVSETQMRQINRRKRLTFLVRQKKIKEMMKAQALTEPTNLK